MVIVVPIYSFAASVVVLVEVEPEVHIPISEPIAQTPQSVYGPLEVVGVVLEQHRRRRLVEIQTPGTVIQSRLQFYLF